jgi:hypothetical protein
MSMPWLSRRTRCEGIALHHFPPDTWGRLSLWAGEAWEAFAVAPASFRRGRVAAGAMFRATRNLWPLIVAHAVIDYGWIV